MNVLIWLNLKTRQTAPPTSATNSNSLPRYITLNFITITIDKEASNIYIYICNFASSIKIRSNLVAMIKLQKIPAHQQFKIEKKKIILFYVILLQTIHHNDRTKASDLS